MLQTLGKIRDFYYGVNEGVKLVGEEFEKEDIAASVSTVDDGSTTRDEDPEDYV